MSLRAGEVVQETFDLRPTFLGAISPEVNALSQHGAEAMDHFRGVGGRSSGLVPQAATRPVRVHREPAFDLGGPTRT